MNFEPFDTSLVVERLKALVPDLREVGGAADYAAVQELRGFQTPSAFVIFASESGNAGPGPRGARVQPAVSRFGLALAVRNYRPGAGDQLGDELRKVLGLTRSALIGWVPPTPGATALAWEAGEVMDYDHSTVLYVESYQLTHLLQK
ncbi:phage tail terminator protein [Comamonas suwonensis]|uniref:Uncharacterized protein n=1 Tax=Comamonas suwonensis TaxID=2606214 RepID=A0A843BCE4_9BURK|nr:hypothetical protein [Comamonas suwonensis]MBI1626920.1 hypothetical protein [Comamonas suwonensis]